MCILPLWQTHVHSSLMDHQGVRRQDTDEHYRAPLFKEQNKSLCLPGLKISHWVEAWDELGTQFSRLWVQMTNLRNTQEGSVEVVWDRINKRGPWRDNPTSTALSKYTQSKDTRQFLRKDYNDKEENTTHLFEHHICPNQVNTRQLLHKQYNYITLEKIVLYQLQYRDKLLNKREELLDNHKQLLATSEEQLFKTRSWKATWHVFLQIPRSKGNNKYCELIESEQKYSDLLSAHYHDEKKKT